MVANTASLEAPAAAVAGTFGLITMCLAALLATAAAVNAAVFSSSRIGVDLAKHGALPKRTVGDSDHPGTAMVVLVGAVVVVLVIAFPLEAIGPMVSLSFLALYAVINIGHLRVRRHTGARRLPLISAVAVNALLFAAGVFLIAYYTRFLHAPGHEWVAQLTDANRVMSHFVSHGLPGYLGAIVIAGLFAGTMSSLTAGLNSLSSATYVDFLVRFGAPAASEQRGVRRAKLVTCVLGGLVMLGAVLMGGHETIFGVSTDPRFGPVLMFGLGGRYVEVFRDVVFGVGAMRDQEPAPANSPIVRRPFQRARARYRRVGRSGAHQQVLLTTTTSA